MGILLSTKAGTITTDTEGGSTEGQDKNCETAPAPMVNAPPPPPHRDGERNGYRDNGKKLWELQRLLNNQKGSLNSTFEKHAEANTRAYDLNQKTIQALDALTMKKVT